MDVQCSARIPGAGMGVITLGGIIPCSPPSSSSPLALSPFTLVVGLILFTSGTRVLGQNAASMQVFLASARRNLKLPGWRMVQAKQALPHAIKLERWLGLGGKTRWKSRDMRVSPGS